MKLSILIATQTDSAELGRTLWSIAKRKPVFPIEVVLADSSEGDGVAKKLALYSSVYKYKHLRFEKETFRTKLYNEAAIAASGELVIAQRPNVIPWGNVYDSMLAEAPATKHWLVHSTAYEIPRAIVGLLDSYGSNILPGYVEEAKKIPLQCRHFNPPDPSFTFSMLKRSDWDAAGGMDETYKSLNPAWYEFTRKLRKLSPIHSDFLEIVSEGISLAQAIN